MWEGRICNKELAYYFVEEIGIDGKCDSYNKKIPRWILELDPKYLNILLEALVDGDGSRINSKYNNSTKSYRYSTVCKQLADDVYELVLKLGYSPNVYIGKHKTGVAEYVVLWSNTKYGDNPLLYPNRKVAGNGGGARAIKVPYQGKVWCFEVPHGLFITRRNGKITIQGNSKFAQADNMINPLTLIKIGGGDNGYKPTPADLEEWRQVFEDAQYDKDFKVFTHEAVEVDRIGYNQGIIDITNDIEKLTKEIYMGLMVPQVLMDGGGDVTYANGGITLDVLKQRYLQFRNILADWLRTKIFAPISRINDFYEKKEGKKILVVPEVEWNHMSLFDAGDYINILTQLRSSNPENPELSRQTVYRSLGLDFEEENRKIKMEAIQDAIHAKEKEALASYSLNELRTLGVDDLIEEKAEEAVPGEEPGVPGEEAPEGLGLPGLGGAPGGVGFTGGGALPEMEGGEEVPVPEEGGGTEGREGATAPETP